MTRLITSTDVSYLAVALAPRTVTILTAPHSEPRPNFPSTLHWLFRPGVKEHCLNTQPEVRREGYGVFCND